MTGRELLVDVDHLVAGAPAELVALAGYGLAPRTPPLPNHPLDANAWAQLLDGVADHRLSGLLARAVADGAIAVTDEQRAAVGVAHRHGVAQCLSLDRVLVEVTVALREAGVPVLALKGAGHALRFAASPSERLYGDVDLLVRGTDFDCAAAVVVARGGERHQPDPQPGYVARFGKSAAFTVPGGWEVDLHRTLALGPFGVSAGRHDLLADPPASIRLAGHDVAVPAPPTALLVAAFHAVLPSDDHRLVPLRDVAELAAPGRAEPAATVALAVRWRCAAVLAAAVEAADAVVGRAAGPAPLLMWAKEYEPSRRERRWLAHYRDDHPAAYLRRTLDELDALESPGERAAYVTAIARTSAADAEPWPHRLVRLARTVKPPSS